MNFIAGFAAGFAAGYFTTNEAVDKAIANRFKEGESLAFVINALVSSGIIKRKEKA